MCKQSDLVEIYVFYFFDYFYYFFFCNFVTCFYKGALQINVIIRLSIMCTGSHTLTLKYTEFEKHCYVNSAHTTQAAACKNAKPAKALPRARCSINIAHTQLILYFYTFEDPLLALMLLYDLYKQNRSAARPLASDLSRLDKS